MTIFANEGTMEEKKEILNWIVKELEAASEIGQRERGRATVRRYDRRYESKEKSSRKKLQIHKKIKDFWMLIY